MIHVFDVSNFTPIVCISDTFMTEGEVYGRVESISIIMCTLAIDSLKENIICICLGIRSSSSGYSTVHHLVYCHTD